MPRQYTMHAANQIAQIAAREIETWLRARPETLRTQNVEADPHYRALDVDLLWETRRGVYHIEIKADRWHTTGNFFFETQSNQEKGTLGCFLYTQADLLFYYFVTPRTLYILPMPATRDWFLANRERFPERATTTPVSAGMAYTTVGCLVPVETVLRHVSGIAIKQI